MIFLQLYLNNLRLIVSVMSSSAYDRERKLNIHDQVCCNNKNRRDRGLHESDFAVVRQIQLAKDGVESQMVMEELIHETMKGI